ARSQRREAEVVQGALVGQLEAVLKFERAGPAEIAGRGGLVAAVGEQGAAQVEQQAFPARVAVLPKHVLRGAVAGERLTGTAGALQHQAEIDAQPRQVERSVGEPDERGFGARGLGQGGLDAARVGEDHDERDARLSGAAHEALAIAERDRRAERGASLGQFAEAPQRQAGGPDATTGGSTVAIFPQSASRSSREALASVWTSSTSAIASVRRSLGACTGDGTTVTESASQASTHSVTTWVPSGIVHRSLSKPAGTALSEKRPR